MSKFLLFKNSSYVKLRLLNKNCTRQVEAKVLFETILRGVKTIHISREIDLNSAEINGKIIFRLQGELVEKVLEDIRREVAYND